MACTLVGVGLLMTWLERWHNEDDYGHVRRSLAPCASRALTPPSHTPSCAPRCPAQVLYTPLTHKVMHGVYYAFAGFASKTEEFTPKTAAGRVLALANAFADFLAISFYIANLAAVFTNTAQPVQVRARARLPASPAARAPRASQQRRLPAADRSSSRRSTASASRAFRRVFRTRRVTAARAVSLGGRVTGATERR